MQGRPREGPTFPLTTLTPPAPPEARLRKPDLVESERAASGRKTSGISTSARPPRTPPLRLGGSLPAWLPLQQQQPVVVVAVELPPLQQLLLACRLERRPARGRRCPS